jgi:hypothetical protein
LLYQNLQTVGLIFDFIGALLLLIPLLKREEEIEKELHTVIGGNPHLRKAMKRDRLLGLVGFIFLILGFAFQIVAIFV